MTTRSTQLAERAWKACGTDQTLLNAWATTLSDADTKLLARTWLTERMEAIERRHTLQHERRSEKPTTGRGPRRTPTPTPTPTPRPLAPVPTPKPSGRLVALAAQVSTLVDTHRASLVIDWTPELRRQPIRMPDGTRTTWGAATIEQHKERAHMFEHYATTNIEGAARHRQAIDDLSRAHARCLDDLVKGAE